VPPLSPENDPAGSVTMFFHQICDGESEALQPLWNHYFPRLMRLAERTLCNGNRRVAGADDAVQSAFFSFWQQAGNLSNQRDFHRDNLWAMLSVMTVRKARKQLRRESAQKRGGGQQPITLDVIAEIPASAARDAFQSLSPQEFDVHSEELLMLLDESLRPFAVLKLIGHSNGEIANIQSCTERTVERKLRLIRLAWSAELIDR
jgi:DNA-directed RNA polymerase specialized sigma24 family protein